MKGQHDVFAATAEAARHRREVAAAIAAERARCAAVCREVAARQSAHLGCGAAESARDEADARSNAALECAEAIERGAVERLILDAVAAGVVREWDDGRGRWLWYNARRGRSERRLRAAIVAACGESPAEVHVHMGAPGTIDPGVRESIDRYREKL